MGRTLREWEGLGILKTIPALLYTSLCKNSSAVCGRAFNNYVDVIMQLFTDTWAFAGCGPARQPIDPELSCLHMMYMRCTVAISHTRSPIVQPIVIPLYSAHLLSRLI